MYCREFKSVRRYAVHLCNGIISRDIVAYRNGGEDGGIMTMRVINVAFIRNRGAFRERLTLKYSREITERVRVRVRLRRIT